MVTWATWKYGTREARETKVENKNGVGGITFYGGEKWIF